MSTLPRSVIERSSRRKEVSIHPLARPNRYVETQFVTHRAQVRSLALSRLIDVITGESAKTARPRAR